MTPCRKRTRFEPGEALGPKSAGILGLDQSISLSRHARSVAQRLTRAQAPTANKPFRVCQSYPCPLRYKQLFTVSKLLFLIQGPHKIPHNWETQRIVSRS